ncbi:unnamed protein product [Allacma fusca]|uniref:C2H2-type domain-containing protein n=1 Tax=Allacma fusca TaxID=39272 RepID=A0A8J2L6N4_9HEXA|nr:unnamed protein product [Allacma fusca]
MKRRKIPEGTAFKATSNEKSKNTPAKRKGKGTPKRRTKYSNAKFYRRKLVHPYPCQYCLSDFDLESDRVEHLLEVHCTTTHGVICRPCGKLFVSEQVKNFHAPKCGIIPSRYVMPPYICDECGKDFDDRSRLWTHQKFTHSNERRFPCDHCNYRAKTLAALTLHQSSMHIVSEQVECPECHKSLKNQLYFENHFKRMHTPKGYRQYVELSKRQSDKRKEKRRKNRVTTSVCSECNIDFQTVPRYISHRSKVHVTTKNWQCEQCGKGFNCIKVFQNHQMYVHTDERPFICDKCGMNFKNPKNLKTHIDRVHTEGGRLKYNSYNRENYKRKQILAQELSKAKDLECPDDSHVDEGTVFEVGGSSATESILE